ncbi:MAG: chromate resistance protein ChrB domain-containing protein [Microbacteriaceae bacterium]
MKWITRARPKTDRIACPWLICEFIDANAEIVFVPAAEVLDTAAAEHGRSFDSPGAEFGHRPARDGEPEWCTFETLIDAFDLAGNPALARMAKIVHAADIDRDLATDPAGAGLLAIGLGGLDVEQDDQMLLQRGLFVYDALYAWCRQQVEAVTA